MKVVTAACLGVAIATTFGCSDSRSPVAPSATDATVQPGVPLDPAPPPVSFPVK